MARLSSAPALIATVKAGLRPPVKLADPFYESRDWRRFASAIKRHRGYVCEDCGKDCAEYPFTLKADHIIERKDGGADFDPLNIRLRCQACDNAKTARAKAERWG